METEKQQKKMKFRIICDDSESLDFFEYIINHGCLNCRLNKDELKERFPTYYPALQFDVKYIKNSEEIENFFDRYIKEDDISKSNKEDCK